MMKKRIYFVEDHDIVREMVGQLIEMEDDLTICGCCERAEEVLEALPDLEADLLLVDTALPGINGIELVETVRTRRPEMPCLMYSGHGEASYIARSFAAGAQGYVLKGEPDELTTAIRRVLAGEQYLSEALTT